MNKSFKVVFCNRVYYLDTWETKDTSVLYENAGEYHFTKLGCYTSYKKALKALAKHIEKYAQSEE